MGERIILRFMEKNGKKQIAGQKNWQIQTANQQKQTEMIHGGHWNPIHYHSLSLSISLLFEY